MRVRAGFDVWPTAAERLLLAINIEPIVARKAGAFLRLASLLLPANFLYLLLSKFLQVQGIVKPFIGIGVLVNASNILCNHLFIVVFGWVRPAARWMAATHARAAGADRLGGDAHPVVLCAVLLAAAVHLALAAAGRHVARVRVRAAASSIHGGRFSAAGLYEWGAYLRLGVPGLVMICLEWWVFETCQFLAGSFGTAALAAQISILQFSSIWFMIPLGLRCAAPRVWLPVTPHSTAASIRVGNHLGANDGPAARLTAHVAIIVDALYGGLARAAAPLTGTGLLIVAVVLSSRHQLARLLSSDAEGLRACVGTATHAAQSSSWSHRCCRSSASRKYSTGSMPCTPASTAAVGGRTPVRCSTFSGSRWLGCRWRLRWRSGGIWACTACGWGCWPAWSRRSRSLRSTLCGCSGMMRRPALWSAARCRTTPTPSPRPPSWSRSAATASLLLTTTARRAVRVRLCCIG